MAEGLRELLVGDWWRYTISLLGTLMLTVGVGSLLLDGQLTNEELLQGVALVFACLLLIAVGARTALEIREWNQMALVLAWMSLGVIVLGAIGAWGVVVLPTVGTPFEQALVFLSVIAFGALFGAVVGYYDVRMRAMATRAGRERARREFLDDQQETLSSLNGILRHQILNDLSVISGRAELLDAEKIEVGTATESIIEHCEHMEQTIDRVETLVDILTHVNDPGERDIQQAISHAEAVAKESHPDLTVEITDDDSLLTRADELLHLALAEVFENSAVHGNGAVTVSLRETVDTVCLEISDDGSGVELAESSLFQPNTRGPESDGDGLGLYFASLIIERYDGDISLDCTGSRTTFVITLPKKPRQVPENTETALS